MLKRLKLRLREEFVMHELLFLLFFLVLANSTSDPAWFTPYSVPGDLVSGARNDAGG